MVQEINENNYKGVISENDVVVVKFGADWCSPCKALKPKYDELSEKHNAMFCEINIDENPSIAEEFAIKSIPAIGIWVKGEKKAWYTGSGSISQLNDILPTIHIEE